jgi:cytochrome P450
MREDMSWGTPWLLGGFILGLVYFLRKRFAAEVRRRNIISTHGCKTPSRFPVWDPVFGLDVMYQTIQAHKRKTLLSTKRSHHQVYGMTHSSRLATVPAISTIEPENIKAVLSTNFKDFVVGTPRRRAFSPIIANSILVADGVEWEHSRAFLKPSFSRSQVGDLEILEAHVKHLIKAIPRDGSTVDLAELFLRYTADVTTDLMFGESIFSLPHPEAFGGELAQACRDAQVGAERRFVLGKFADLVPQRAFYRSVEKIHAYVNSHVEKAIQHRLSRENAEKADGKDDGKDNGKHVFLRELAKLTDDRLILRDQLLGIFFAGRDTTAALLSNLFFVLARNSDVWQRLHEEIASLEGRQPTLDELKKLKYLSTCLNESPTHTSLLVLRLC